MLFPELKEKHHTMGLSSLAEVPFVPLIWAAHLISRFPRTFGFVAAVALGVWVAV